ncbi:MAG TPA: hypothetical protein VKQ27_21085 [Acetobacteraceae bacterium]|nr:hypothetical protein [Acetobacteraceae bacterium]
MRTENNDVRPSRAARLDADGGGAQTPTSAGQTDPATGNAPSPTRAPNVGAPRLNRDRTARALERGIVWESVLLLGVAVVIACLAVVMWEVADFGARFVARAVATELVTVRAVRVHPANLARPAHDAPPSLA